MTPPIPPTRPQRPGWDPRDPDPLHPDDERIPVLTRYPDPKPGCVSLALFLVVLWAVRR